jgi:predicted NBD/HSP70 family sugar kinase
MDEKPSCLKLEDSSDGIIVFDIGGSWFRSGLFTPDGKLEAVTKCAAINFINTPHTNVKDLQIALLDYFVDRVNQISQLFPTKNIQEVGISMGAALNAHTSFVLDSAPLWGANASPTDLLKTLRERKQELLWMMINDVSAALWRYVIELEESDNLKICLITISTGIACRTYDSYSKKILVDRKYGVQGEIGHIPIDFEYENRPIHLCCDCGRMNHLSAFCSGRGVAQLLQLLAAQNEQKFRSSILSYLTDGASQQLTFEHFSRAIHEQDLFATSILDAITLPIAKLLINMWTFDPQVERVIFTGGVIDTLKNYYLDSLLENLHKVGLYLISSSDDSFFRSRIVLGKHDDHSGLIGAGLSVKKKVDYL